ncbi:flavin-containing monooxygenase [Arthrobacter sp. NPDC055138]
MNTESAFENLPEVDVIIVGTGFSGLGLGIKLAREGGRSFLLLERAGDVGGTWRDNTYPGVCCDVPSHLYSYSFRPNPDWSMVRSPGHEIHEYLQEAAREEGILTHCRFNTEVRSAKWDDSTARWVVETTQGTYRSRFFAPAMGLLAEGKVPPIPGLEDFEGEIFHSSSWRHDVPLKGKRIGVVGTGASAIQIIPELAQDAAELVVFQRTPAYILPRQNRHYTQAEQRMFARDPQTRQAHRSDIFWFSESTFAERRRVPQALAQVTAMVDRFREAQVPDPQLRAKLTPDYELGCKRVLYSDDYYPAFSRDNVTLETSALARVEGRRAVSAAGNEFDLDVIVLATGFEATEPPFAKLIHGRDGVLLADHWSTGMEAYQTLTVSRFPNLFIISAPSAATGHTSAVYTIEAQLEHVMDALQWAREHQVETIEVRREEEEAFVEEVHARGQGTVWLEGGCNSWYIDQRNGKLTLIWPDFAYVFRDEIGHFTPEAYDVVHTAALV